MTIYVFGNPDEPSDNRVFELVKHFPDFNFQFIPVNGDLPTEQNLIILDTVYGVPNICLLSQNDLDKLVASPATTAHDYDLGFQLKYLTKLGKINNFQIIAIPPTGPLDYDLIHSIFKKLVAQDIHGS